jgi:hypothetical protein
LPDQRERVIQRTQRGFGKDHVVERPPRLDRLDQLVGRGAEEEIADGVGHVSEFGSYG